MTGNADEALANFGATPVEAEGGEVPPTQEVAGEMPTNVGVQ